MRRRHGGVPGRQPQQALARARPQATTRTARCSSGWPTTPTSCSRTTARASRRGSARTTRRWREVNPRLIYALDLRLRADRPVRAAAGLRPDRAGAGGRDERHRRAGRRPGQVRDPDRRPLGRAVLRGRRSCRRCTRASGPAAGSRSTPRCSRARWRCRSGRRRSCGRPGACRGKLGSAHRLTAPYQALRTADGHITVGAQHAGAVRAAVRGDRAPRACSTTRASPSNDDRMAQRAELRRRAGGDARRARARTSGSPRWWRRGVPCGPIHDYAEVFADPHTQAREMEVERRAPGRGHDPRRSGSR